MKIIVSFFLACTVLSSFGAEDPVWHCGSIVSAENEVKVGVILIHPAFDLIIFKDSSGVKTYAAHQLSSLRFYDEKNNINRKYISLSDAGSHFAKFKLYEVVLNSEVKVVRRIGSVMADPNNDRDGYAYFVIFEEALVPFQQFNKKVWPFLNARAANLNKVIAEASLNAQKHSDIIPIIKMYQVQRVAQKESREIL